VLQQLLLDVSHQPFPELLHDTVLAPIGMARSTYEQPLPVELRAGAATAHTADDAPIEGGFYTYPEMAGGGLWTTPTDLARFAIEIQRSLRGDANHVLSADMTRQMLVAGTGKHGLGFPIGGSVDNPFFSHGGINAGFEAVLVAYEHSGDGAVVMTNAQGGRRLAGEIMRGIASVYGWPDIHPIVRTSVRVDPAILATYTGVYQFTPTFSITVTMEDGQLMAQESRQRNMPLFAESQSRFFWKIVDGELEFIATDAGQITHLVLHRDGQDWRGKRKQ
jgi:CubicO group peptidase (beta-lactamase class C family)